MILLPQSAMILACNDGANIPQWFPVLASEQPTKFFADPTWRRIVATQHAHNVHIQKYFD
jgi:hypothetical protein